MSNKIICQGCEEEEATFKLVFKELEDEFCCNECLINVIREDPQSLETIIRMEE